MLTITKHSANRLDIELSGALGTQAMREGLDMLIDESADITKGRMLYRIRDFEMPSMGALAVEFKQMPKLFSLIGKFEKCAVVSDASWIRTVAELEGFVLPTLEIRSFPLEAEQQAEDWLEGTSTGSSAERNENFPV